MTTTENSRCTVSLCLVVHQRPAELLAALGSARNGGFDEILVLDMASEPPIQPVDGVRWLRFDDNRGVSAGRNALAEAAVGEVLFFLDDDAVIQTPALAEVLRDLFLADPHLAAVACRIERSGGVVHRTEYPFRGSLENTDISRPAAYFVGAAHAVRASDWRRVGGLDESFFYSTEEIDLSMKLLSMGHRIWYTTDIVVKHLPSAAGRSVRPQVPALRLRNRLIYARRHLPLPVCIIHALTWAIRTAREAATTDGFGLWTQYAKEGLTAPVERSPLPWRSLWKVHRLGGRVLW